jgi:hypothetical protein
MFYGNAYKKALQYDEKKDNYLKVSREPRRSVRVPLSGGMICEVIVIVPS